jgi:hypothetical protein
MIEKMIIKVKPYLPLKISEVIWDGTVLNMYGLTWNFTTLSAWRISKENKLDFGCFDENSDQLISCIKNLEILDLDIQCNLLKIDPVFVFSNGQKLEIFSTDTYEPWTFQIVGLGFFSGTPSE